MNCWNECVRFHGHSCPGLAIGYRIAMAALDYFKKDMTLNTDEDIVCVCENDSCAVDAVQWLNNCTVGKGNLLFHVTGKMAFNFYSRKSSKSVRILPKPSKPDLPREEKIDWLLHAPAEEILEFKPVLHPVPKRAQNFPGVTCERCQETAAENHMHLQNGQIVCEDCFESYS